MQYKVYIITLMLLICAKFGFAQTDFQKTDSISVAFYNDAKWPQLISFGKTAFQNGDDFPALRLRVAYAAFRLENYSLALLNYEKVLSTDKYNQVALYYAYLCNIYLNRPKEASYLVKYIEGKSVDGILIKPTYLTAVGAETAEKFTANINRGNANFTRAFGQLRANYDVYIDNSVLFYNQDLGKDDVHQAGNYLKINYIPAKNISIIGAWNYLHTVYLQTSSETNAVLLGLKYAHPNFSAQIDFNFTNNDGEHIRQYNFQLLNYLKGNLNFYVSNRISYLNAAVLKSVIYNPSIGAKTIKNLWLEVGANFGKQYYFSEVDGLYQYNSPDHTAFKSSANAYYLLKKHVVLNLGYSLENKTDDKLKDYSQHSINANITWNF
jgi:hypothetical protein